jgi:hypothetical protein
MRTQTKCRFDAMKERNFGDIRAYEDDGEWVFEQHGGFCYQEKEMEQLENDIRSARMWVKDQKRRQEDAQTPELPMG